VTHPTEDVLAGVLAELVGAEEVSVESHFFDDLGADSMVMARFCARVRKRADLPSVSMKDIYRYPTIRCLAAALESSTADPVEPSVPAPIEPAAPGRTGPYVVCGALQVLFFLGYTYLAAAVGVRGYDWTRGGSGWIGVYVRSVEFGTLSFLGACTLPILAKWMLVGRWRPQQISIWSVAYVRFWIVKTLLRTNPLALLVGSSAYTLYLRALGANIGRGVVILSKHLPVCADLLTIGDGTVIRKDSFFTCYRARAGLIETGAVTLGKGVLVSEATVLDIDTSMGDGAQLGHRSSLHAGQAVPDGERWHGSPAQPTDVDYRRVAPTGCGTLRRAAYAVVQVLYLLIFGLPLAITGAFFLVDRFPRSPGFLDVLIASLLIFFGCAIVGLCFVATVPRLLNLAITPDRVYPLYGFQYGAQRTVTRLTNIKFFTTLFGDSSYIVGYLRGLGYGLAPVVQTGSNFGTELKHETPYLISIGRGTMIADGVSFMNADFSSTSFRVSRVSIGARNFLGNSVHYPAEGRTGENCLLATKVMVPIDGEVRENVGLLGSPPFEIPRSVQRDGRFDHLATGEEFRRRIAAKNRYNRRTMALFLFVRWMHFFGVTLIAASVASLSDRVVAATAAAASLLVILFTVAYSVLVERAVTAFRPLRPRFCSIYEPYFWFHERYWKLLTPPNVRDLFSGTPFKGLFWRITGAKVGRRLFDDGCDVPERPLITIGDDCTLNAQSEIQCHSQEDGTFKSDRVTISSGCTLGIDALVHYGVTMGCGAVLAPGSFLMKGEEVPAHGEWGGNPAREMNGRRGNGTVSREGVAALVAGGFSR
jgi:non-ribosomal peptide synthetase-like protein